MLISIGISILVHFNSFLGQLVPDTTNVNLRRRDETFLNFIAEIFVTSLVAFSLFILNYFVLDPLNPSKKIKMRTILLSILLTVITVTILSDLFFTIKKMLSSGTFQNSFNLLYTFRDLFLSLVVLICIYVIRLINEKQTIRIENERLLRENLQSQYESLKNQVSPHFLFNSLTALKELIYDNPGTASLYVGHLSKVLRYTLQSSTNQTVSLYDELESVESYIFLIKIRYGENLHFDFKINENYNNYRVPPLAVQTLIENAIKHNEISKRHQLVIHIFINENNKLQISNNIKEKITLESGTGIGLSNLSKQYKLLGGVDIRITRADNEFRVEIPILKPTYDEGISS